MRHHSKDEPPWAAGQHAEVWTGRATNRLQWALAAVGAVCMALGSASNWPSTPRGPPAWPRC